MFFRRFKLESKSFVPSIRNTILAGGMSGIGTLVGSVLSPNTHKRTFVKAQRNMNIDKKTDTSQKNKSKNPNYTWFVNSPGKDSFLKLQKKALVILNKKIEECKQSGPQMGSINIEILEKMKKVILGEALHNETFEYFILWSSFYVDPKDSEQLPVTEMLLKMGISYSNYELQEMNKYHLDNALKLLLSNYIHFRRPNTDYKTTYKYFETEPKDGRHNLFFKHGSPSSSTAPEVKDNAKKGLTAKK